MGGISFSIARPFFLRHEDGSLIAVYGAQGRDVEAIVGDLARVIRQETQGGTMFLLVDVDTARVYAFDLDELRERV